MRKNSERIESLSKFEEVIDYKFKDITILNRALTHSSYANEHKKSSISYNERLEFLGDSVLSLIVSDYIYKKYPDYPEGDLTKLRAAVVCELALAYIAKNLKLGDYLLLGKGEEATGGRDRTSILADALEALIGAIYLDRGLEASKQFVINLLENEIIQAAKEGDLFTDYKTKLQETLQKTSKSKIEYKIEKEVGPDHDKKFYMSAIINSEVCGRGWGRNKKEAEQMAAKEVLNRMGVYYE
ncbi:ribonuclease III [Anaerosalibacter sp. Marseille-P3206]|uniref:ribonuclease III n=1 Tax=Anaerosalibacter sp. Marseille-P3206 TaxID=1871005 RepID=UPI0009849192|nr:ribonuclease III [Anaerosalibacter sp. Marseille-P3206]